MWMRMMPIINKKWNETKIVKKAKKIEKEEKKGELCRYSTDVWLFIGNNLTTKTTTTRRYAYKWRLQNRTCYRLTHFVISHTVNAKTIPFSQIFRKIMNWNLIWIFLYFNIVIGHIQYISKRVRKWIRANRQMSKKYQFCLHLKYFFYNEMALENNVIRIVKWKTYICFFPLAN